MSEGGSPRRPASPNDVYHANFARYLELAKVGQPRKVGQAL